MEQRVLAGLRLAALPVALPDRFGKCPDRLRDVCSWKVRDALRAEGETQGAVEEFQDVLDLRGLLDQEEGLHPCGLARHPLRQAGDLDARVPPERTE